MITRTAASLAVLIVFAIGPGGAVERPGRPFNQATPSKRQQATFSAGVDIVRVDVLVTENGQPVRGLTAGDFEVFDEGVRQQVDLLSVENLPLNLVLAFDVSDSVAGTRLGQLRSASDVLLEQLRAGDRVGLVTFNNLVRLRSKLTTDFSALRSVLEEVRAGGGTALFDGTYLALLGAAPEGPRGLLIVFSDGIDTASWLSADAVVDAGRRVSTVAYAVSVADAGRSPAFLGELTAATGGRVIELESTWSLSSTFVDVLDEFRQRYLISYAPRGVPKSGWHRLDVRVRGRKVTARARQGYFAGP